MSLIVEAGLHGQPPDFERSLRSVLGAEGGWSNHAADRGGKTMWGVTESVARKHGWRGRMQDLPLEWAIQIYRTDYWDPFRFDEIPSLLVTTFLFDCAVNHGGGGMALVAQRACEKRVRLVVDGRWGPQTRGVCRDLVCQGYELNLLGALADERGDYFTWIQERRPDQRAFYWGWQKRNIP